MFAVELNLSEAGGDQVRVLQTWIISASAMGYVFEWKYLIINVLKNDQRD